MLEDEAAIARLETALGHRFSYRALLLDALTHRSFANERPKESRGDNERLEFLGDSVLSAVVSSMLFRRFSEASEGELTRRRADLVCEASLADVALELEMGDALRLGRGEQKSGGREKPRLLASALEACIGAIFIDGGFDSARDFIERAFGARVEAGTPGASDYKSRLQELTQGRSLGTPSYDVLSTHGPDHARRFEVEISVGEEKLARGRGRSKLEAEQGAAEEALRHLTQASSDTGE